MLSTRRIGNRCPASSPSQSSASRSAERTAALLPVAQGVACYAALRGGRSGGREADPPGVGLRDVDIGDQIRRHDYRAAPVVGELELPVDALQRAGDKLLDLFGRL